MSRSLTYPELIQKICRKSGYSKTTVEKIIRLFIDSIAEEMRIAGEIRVPNFALFFTVPYEGRVDKATGRWIESRDLCKTKFSSNFKDLVNGKIVTKTNRQKLRQGKRCVIDEQLQKANSDNVDALLQRMSETGEPIDSQLVGNPIKKFF